MSNNVRNDELLKRIGSNIRRLREEKGMSQEKLAELADISQVQVARIEAGRNNVTISTLWAICEALGSDVKSIAL